MSSAFLIAATAINLLSIAVLLQIRRERKRLQFLRYGAKGRPRRRDRRRPGYITSPRTGDPNTGVIRPRERVGFGERPAGGEPYGW